MENAYLGPTSNSSNTPMFDFPPSTIVNRPIPKSKILERSRPTTRQKELLTHQIQQILWYAKLSPDTIRIPDTPQVPEIQIFHLLLKGKDIDSSLLDFLDKSIPQPILWRLETLDHRFAHSAAYKRPSEADSSQWVVGSRFTSDFISAEKLTPSPLPTALDLSHLYTAMLAPLLPLSPRRNESLSDLIERCGLHQSLQRRIERLNAKMHCEKHFNRKVELNQELKHLNMELEKVVRVQ
jgi:hypothetical protein